MKGDLFRRCSHGVAHWALNNLDAPLGLMNVAGMGGRNGRVLEEEVMDDRTEAEAYHALVETHGRLLHAPFVKFLDTLDIGHGTALDIGCGPGQLTVALALRHPGLKLHGVDLSSEMLARARSHAARAGVADRVTFEQADAKTLVGENGAYNLVYSHFTLHHLETPSVLLDAADRLAGDEGTVVIRDLRRLPAWLVETQVLFSRWALRYTPVQIKQCRESLRASLSWAEAVRHCRNSRLRDATLTRTSLLDYVIVRPLRRQA